MSLRPQIPVRTSESDATLSFIRQMGVENVSLMLKPDEINREVQQQKEKAGPLRHDHFGCGLQ